MFFQTFCEFYEAYASFLRNCLWRWLNTDNQTASARSFPGSASLFYFMFLNTKEPQYDVDA